MPEPDPSRQNSSVNQDSRSEGLQRQIDALSLRMDQGEVDRQSLRDRTDAIEKQLDVDRAMIESLHADGVLNERHARDMEAALRSSRTIGAALGIIMESRQVSEDEAFAILRQASNEHNRKLRELAEDLVNSHAVRDPSP